MARFGEVVVAMVTPFDADGALDLDGAAELARWLTTHGVDGLVLAGTTGESPTLSAAEEVELYAAVREAVSVPLVAGAGGNDTAASIALTEQATATGVDAIMAVTPYYSRPAQAGIDAHFRAVAAATDLPVMLYDIPVRTGRKIESETILRLAHEVDNIVALKDAAGNPGETARVVAESPDDFEVYSGEDALNLALLAVGAVGFVSVAAHWSGAEHREMVDAFASGDVVKAREINARLVASYRFETGPDAPNPIPTKAMMRVLGLPAGQCRLPVGEAPAGVEDDARTLLAALGPR